MQYDYRLRDRALGSRLEAVDGFPERLNRAAEAQMDNGMCYVTFRLSTPEHRMQFTFQKTEIERVPAAGKAWFVWPEAVPPADVLLRVETLAADAAGGDVVTGRFCAVFRAGAFLEANTGEPLTQSERLRFREWDRG